MFNNITATAAAHLCRTRALLLSGPGQNKAGTLLRHQTPATQLLCMLRSSFHHPPESQAPTERGATSRETEACLDLVGRLEAVELVEQLEHGALHLAVAAAAAVVCARAADAVHLVHEDDGRRVLPGQKQMQSKSAHTVHLVHEDDRERRLPATLKSNSNASQAMLSTSSMKMMEGAGSLPHSNATAMRVKRCCPPHP